MSKKSDVVNILLVEDNPADVFLVEEAFGEVGFAGTLHVARDGQEALDLVRGDGGGVTVVPDLILLDLNLPRLSGLEVLRALKSDARLRLIPVVVLTTSSAPQDVRRCYDLHANSYCTKPGSLAGLIEFTHSLERFWVRNVMLPTRIA